MTRERSIAISSHLTFLSIVLISRASPILVWPNNFAKVPTTHTVFDFGSPAYMAPEQITDNISRIGPATDIYSLGAVLYHVVTGRPPFQGDTLHQVLRQAQENEP